VNDFSNDKRVAFWRRFRIRETETAPFVRPTEYWAFGVDAAATPGVGINGAIKERRTMAVRLVLSMIVWFQGALDLMANRCS